MGWLTLSLQKKPKQEALWERDLRNGKYTAALDYVLERKLPAVTVLSLLISFRHRSALRAALEGRNYETIQPIFAWVTTHITDPRYVKTCVDVSMIILDLYSEHVGESHELGRLIRRLHQKVKLEVSQFGGGFENWFASSVSTRPHGTMSVVIQSLIFRAVFNDTDLQYRSIGHRMRAESRECWICLWSDYHDMIRGDFCFCIARRFAR